jgi:hypothetical protein
MKFVVTSEKGLNRGNRGGRRSGDGVGSRISTRACVVSQSKRTEKEENEN